MYDREKHLQLLAKADIAWRQYESFIKTEPLIPGQRLEPTDFEGLKKADKEYEAARKVERDYWQQFFNNNGRFDPKLDE